MIAIISIIESMKRGRPELVARGGWCCVAWPVPVVRGDGVEFLVIAGVSQLFTYLLPHLLTFFLT